MKIFIYSLAILSAAAVPDDLFAFLEDYASEEFFWTPMYNIIECSEMNEIKWIRTISSVYHGLVGIHATKEEMDLWVNITGSQTFFLNVNCPYADSILKQIDHDPRRNILQHSLIFLCIFNVFVFLVNTHVCKGNTSSLFRSPFQWLLMDDTIFDNFSSPINSDLESKWYWKIVKNLKVLLDAEVRMLTRHENGTIGIVGAYKTSMEGEVIKEELGIWERGDGIAVWTRETKTIRRWDVRGAKLLGSFPIIHPETLNHLEDMVDKHNDPISKVGYVLTKHLSEMINASLELKIVDTWGVNVNGTWTGMIGDIQSEAVEIGVSPAFVLADRMDIVHYYEMITPTKAKFIFLSPPLSFSSNIFAMPFDRLVWLCSWVMMFVSCILLYIATKVEERQGMGSETEVIIHHQHSQSRGKTSYSFSDIVMLNVGAICTQGAAAEPKGPSGRIITLFLHFSYMFLYVSYSGSIVALLQSSDTSIRTFKDLLDSPLVVAADDVVYSQYYFKTESEPTRKALFNKKVAPKGEKPHFVSAQEGIANLRKGLYAFHVETSVGYSLIQKTFTEEEKCGLQEFSTSFFQTVDPLLAMRIDSPFTEYMRVGMKKIIETGLNHRALSRIYIKKPVCSSKSSRFVSVGLLDCYHAFMIITYGTILAWVVFVIEKISFKRVKSLNEQTEKLNPRQRTDKFRKACIPKDEFDSEFFFNVQGT